MKKYFILLAVLFLGACEHLSALQSSETSSLNSCMISEAHNKLTAGTLFTSDVYATAKEISQTCIRKLALQKAGLDETSLNTAKTIINSLKSAQ